MTTDSVKNRARGPALSRAQLAIELARPWLIFAAFIAIAESGHVLLAVPFAVASCFAAFVQMHDALHESLGLSKRWHAAIVTASAQLLLKSGHALKATHLRHHGKCMGHDDPEGAPANWSLGRVLWAGPFHILALRRDALLIAPRTAGRQLAETTATVFVLCAAVLAYIMFGSITGLVYWAVAFAISATMGLWAAYIPHRIAPQNPAVRAAARVAMLWTPVLNSFAYHHVHHAHPRVPTALLPVVARELGEGDDDLHHHHDGHPHHGEGEARHEAGAA